MRSSCLYERAYVRVSRNKGALTPGVDGQTFDGMSLEKLGHLARRVAEGRYRPRPVRRAYIPKASGKLRPLGIPTAEDRLVQEVVRTILAAIYEPVFSQRSHGFRPGRSCHTELEEIRNTWTGVKWLIEVDVREFFDNIDHDILLRLLERRIDDPRFIGLIGQMLKAGCLDDWVYERTYSGTPQGGVVSPRKLARNERRQEGKNSLGRGCVIGNAIMFTLVANLSKASTVSFLHDRYQVRIIFLRQQARKIGDPRPARWISVWIRNGARSLPV
jgi:retron-type reverse transcriptase